MRVVLQRVKKAKVKVGDSTVGAINCGWLVFVGIHQEDTLTDVTYLADKVYHLRGFEDKNGRMNLSVAEINGELLVVSQFTLFGNCRRGRRPSFIEAATPSKGEQLYHEFILALQKKNIPVATGQFGADMEITSSQNGPVTLILESKNP